MHLQLQAYELALVNALCAAVFMNEQHRSVDARKDLAKIFEDCKTALRVDEVNVFDFAGKRFLKVDFQGDVLEIEVKPRPEAPKPKDVPDEDPDPGQSPPVVETKLAMAA